MKLLPYVIARKHGVVLVCFTIKDFALHRLWWNERDGKRIHDPLKPLLKVYGARMTAYPVYNLIVRTYYRVLIRRLFSTADEYAFMKRRMFVAVFGRFRMMWLKWGGRIPSLVFKSKSAMILLGREGEQIRDEFLQSGKTYRHVGG